MRNTVRLYRPWLIDYQEAWLWQRQTADAVRNGADEALAILQHPPVYSFGRRVQRENLLVDTGTLASRGAQVVESDRGGDVTFHGPGQLVAYPILNLRRRNIAASDYVHLLEETMIRAVSRFGITAERSPGRPGVWTAPIASQSAPARGEVISGQGAMNPNLHLSIDANRPSDPNVAEAFQPRRHPRTPHPPALCALHSALGEGRAAVEASPPRAAEGLLAKLGAVGVRVQGGISTHGLALNVDLDLSWFDAIVPCGLSDIEVTSLERLLGYSPGIAAAENALIEAFESVFESTPIASQSAPARGEAISGRRSVGDAAGFILQSRFRTTHAPEAAIGR